MKPNNLTIKSVHFAKGVNLPASAQEILDMGLANGDGIYRVDPLSDGVGFDVYCSFSVRPGEGWMMFAYNTNNITTALNVTTPTTVTLGVVGDYEWKSLRDTFGDGILVIDEHGNNTYMSKQKLSSANVTNVYDVQSLSNLTDYSRGMFIHDEISGTDVKNTDYTIIKLAGVSETVKCAVYQYSNLKFDVWGYGSYDYSYGFHDELFYYIR